MDSYICASCKEAIHPRYPTNAAFYASVICKQALFQIHELLMQGSQGVKPFLATLIYNTLEC